jgi:hypothetical protein
MLCGPNTDIFTKYPTGLWDVLLVIMSFRAVWSKYWHLHKVSHRTVTAIVRCSVCNGLLSLVSCSLGVRLGDRARSSASEGHVGCVIAATGEGLTASCHHRDIWMQPTGPQCTQHSSQEGEPLPSFCTGQPHQRRELGAVWRCWRAREKGECPALIPSK